MPKQCLNHWFKAYFFGGQLQWKITEMMHIRFWNLNFILKIDQFSQISWSQQFFYAKTMFESLVQGLLFLGRLQWKIAEMMHIRSSLYRNGKALE
jgi:hypothetical protein